MGYEDIIYDKKDGVAWITINRPDKLNVFRWQTIDDLTDAFQDADRDGTIGVIVLTGAGDRSFCCGGDIPTMRALDFNSGMLWNKKLLNLAMIMRNAAKPVIAAINGYCLGGGNELNVFCDMTIASDRARFGQAGPRVGSTPMWGATQLLPLSIGDKKAREMIMLCRQYTAEEAERMGLVNKVVPHEKLYDEVKQWCEELLDMSPQSLRMAKLNLNFQSDLLYPSFTHGGELLAHVWASEQNEEGMAAFIEKRKPNFRRYRV